MELKQEDIQEKFIRSRGKGGQNVNKVATCVQLKHLPTGVSVKCDTYRSQKKNRDAAYILLQEKLDNIEAKKLAKEKSDKEKVKRQNRRKPKALKEKILKNKKIQSEKKSMRKKPAISDSSS